MFIVKGKQKLTYNNQQKGAAKQKFYNSTIDDFQLFIKNGINYLLPE